MSRRLIVRSTRTLGRALVLLLAGTAFPLLTASFVAGVLGLAVAAASLHIRRCAQRDGWLAEI